MKLHPFSDGISWGYFITQKKTIVFDTGMISSRESFLAHCGRAQVLPSEISLVVISHEHGDHYAGLQYIKDICAAPVLCHKKAAPFIESGKPARAFRRVHEEARPDIIETLQPGIHPIHPDILISTPYSLEPFGLNGGWILPTPGHSAGSLSLVLERTVLCGDLIMPGDPKHSATPARFAEDVPALKRSLIRLLAFGEAFYGGHSPEPCTGESVFSILEQL